MVANLLPRVEYYHYGGPATIWLRTQEELLRSTSSSLGACMGFSFLVLLVGTRNPLLTSIFILGIGSVVTCVIGTITAMGWVLGIMEATGIIVALPVLYSIAIALFFVLPLCSLIGPEGSTC